MTGHPLVRGVRAVLPAGGRLSRDAFLRRHRGIVILLWLHAAAISAAALDNLGGDRELLRDLLVVFKDEWPERLQAMHTAVAGASAPDLMQAAHALKGALRVLGVDDVTAIAERLETFAREGRSEDATGLIARLEREGQGLLDAITAWVDRDTADVLHAGVGPPERAR